jgi:hypothetical protein
LKMIVADDVPKDSLGPGPPASYNMDMRILVSGDRPWRCDDLATAVLERLVKRYGPDITIVHGDATGVDTSSAMACRECRIPVEAHPADWDRHGKRPDPESGDGRRRGRGEWRASCSISSFFSSEYRG